MSDKFGFDKPFKKGDIFVYALLFVVVAVLFLACAFSNNDQSEGFVIIADGEEVAVYDFEKAVLNVNSSNNAQIECIQENTYKIITKDGYNVIKIDNHKKSVAVTDTDCGHSKECEHMSFDRGVIVCAPHKLVIKSLKAINSQIVIG